MPMTEKEINMWYSRLPKELAKHTEPSAITRKLISNMEKQISELQKETVGQGKDIDHIKESQIRVEGKLDKFIEKADDCYAGKYVEKELSETNKIIKDMKEMKEKRSYDWLKYAIVTALSVVITMLFSK